MNTQNVLDGQALKTIAESSPTAKAVFDELSKRERDRRRTDINRVKIGLLKQGETIQNEDYTKTWQDLERAHIGKIQKGKNGLPLRFVWNYSLKTVGQAAIEGHDLKAKVLMVAHAVKQKRKYTKKERVEIDGNTESNTTKTLYIPLRKNFPIKIVLPNDVSNEELSIINNAIKSM